MAEQPEAETLGQAATRLERELFVGREAEVATYTEWLVSEARFPAVIDLHGPGGVGKTALLQAWARIAVDHGRKVVRVDGTAVGLQTDALLRALAGEPVRSALERLNAAKPLILVDAFEELAELVPFVRDQLLPALGPGVKMVISGRHSLQTVLGALVPYRRLVLPIALQALSGAEARAYVARRGIEDPELVCAILTATRGHALALSLAADIVEHFGVRDLAATPEWPLALRTVAERLLRGVGDPMLRELLEACAVLRCFDESTLAAVSGRDDISDAFARLCRLSLVRPGERGLALHGDVRAILAEDLRWRRPERYRELALRRFSYYRNRARTATDEEREWLLTERLYLWGHALGESFVFSEDESAAICVVPGEAHEADDLAGIYRCWLRDVLSFELGVTPEGEQLETEVAFLRAVLVRDDVLVRVARTDVGVIGFSTVVPLTPATHALLAAHPAHGPLLRSLLGPEDAAALPRIAADATLFYHLILAHQDLEGDAVRAALVRRWIQVFARGGAYLLATPLPSWKAGLEALGFRRLDARGLLPLCPEVPIQGYLLDLRTVGIETWMEAVLSGRPLPRMFGPAEIETELHAVLTHWHEDRIVASSPLAEIVAVSADALPTQRAEQLRNAVEDAITKAQSEAPRERLEGLRALEAAYLMRSVSLEQCAQKLSMSRTSFFRALKRARQDVALALMER